MIRRIFLSVLVASIALAASPALAVGGHLEGYVPAAAHGAGKLGSFWTTDLWIYQQGASVIHLWFNPAGQDNSAVESVVVPLSEPVTRLTDVVASLFETEGIGSIHYLADGPVTVTSRTWTAAPGGGSYGQTIPGIPIASASIAGTGQAGTLRTVVDQRSGFRANLGLVNVSPVSITVLVEIFTSDGNPAPGTSSFTVELQPFGMTQMNDILAQLDPGERAGLIVRAGISSSEGGLMAYLSTVDNTTNDPSYQEAFRFGF